MLILALIAVFFISLRISGYMYKVSGALRYYPERQRSWIALVGGAIFASCCTYLFYYLT